MAEELVLIQENEYRELLLQTVAVIEHARINVARRIAVTTSNTYWEIGKLLHEKKLEKRLVEKIKLFLLELGKGFTFIGNQYAIEYNGKESRVDMLFFHRGLRNLVAIDLKIGKFIPEYAGKMNYYLSLLDRTERQEGENPPIGIILCAEKDRLDVELALEGMTKPIGVADYKLIIPKEELQKTIVAEIQSFEEEHAEDKTDKS